MYKELTKKELLEELAALGYKITWNTKQLSKARLQDLLTEVANEEAFIAASDELEDLIKKPFDEQTLKIKKSCFHQN